MRDSESLQANVPLVSSLYAIVPTSPYTDPIDTYGERIKRPWLLRRKQKLNRFLAKVVACPFDQGQRIT